MFVDVEFLGVLVYLLFVLQHQIDKQIAVVEYGLRPNLSIQTMVEQYYFMPHGVIFGANEDVAGMRIAVHKPMLVDHRSKDFQ